MYMYRYNAVYMYTYMFYLQTGEQCSIVHHDSIYIYSRISAGYMYGSGGTQLNMFSSSFRMLLSVMCGGLAG